MDIEENSDATSTALFGSASSEAQISTSAALSADNQQAIAALPPNSALLIVQRGPNTGARFLLNSEKTTTGRHPVSDIFLDDVTVSRRHAEFLLTKDGFTVRDAGSLNGTYVNGERIDEPLALRAGDEVQVGKFRLTYHPPGTS